MSIILIGMPSSGKSTVGVILAKRLGYKFIDSDLLIQEQTGQILCDIIAQRGPDGFIALEESVNCGISDRHAVISTGGSAIYSPAAMEWLRSLGKIVYLEISYDEMVARLGDYEHRGIVMPQDMTLRQLYDERKALYERYADVIICAENRSIGKTVDDIARGS